MARPPGAGIRFLTVRPGRDGLKRYYWQPTARVRAAGFLLTRLPDNAAEAAREAARLNAAVNEAMGVITSPAPPQPSEAVRCGELAPDATARWTYLYVVGTINGSQKIGISKRPASRVRELETSGGRKLRTWLIFGCEFISAKEVERVAQTLLAPQRREGEWFACEPGVAVNAVVSALARRWAGRTGQTMAAGLSSSVQPTTL